MTRVFSFVRTSIASVVLSAAASVACAAAPATAPTTTAVTLAAADGATVFGDYTSVANPHALILLFHQAGSNRAEYATIAPRLAKAGYSTLAIDQRSGGDLFGAHNATARKLGREASFMDARKDLDAALAWAHADGRRAPVVAWGSSYSAALVFLLAADHPRDVAAVMAFSPGEYLGKPHLVRDAAAKVTVPVYITSAQDKQEIANARAILDAVASTSKTQYVPTAGGVHGASTLRADRNAKGMAANWAAVLAFLHGLDTK